MKYGIVLLLFSSACNFTESKITYGNVTTPSNSAVSTAPAVIIQPHIVNRNQFAEQMYNIFSPDEINYGTSAAALDLKAAMSNSVWSSRYFMTLNTGDELGEGCDPYVMAYNGAVAEMSFSDTYRLQREPSTITNAKYACLMIQAGAQQAGLHAKTPSGKIDVYAASSKIRWCENLVSSVTNGSVGSPGYAWHNTEGYTYFGMQDFLARTNGATLASVALHKAFKSSQDLIDFTFSPDFNVNNIIKVVSLFYPTEENLSEAASMYLKLDTVYPENGLASFNAKQRYEKWKVVISGTCQSLYWEIL
jgi:hypothetical protein